MENNAGKTQFFICFEAFAITVTMMLLLFLVKGYAPFGTNSLAWVDANIQYLDFFAYLKEVMAGNDSIIYSYGKTLGGSNIAVFSYYLTSPFNILVAFFDQSELNTFLDIVVALKLGTAAITFSYFLQKRFNGKINAIYAIMLSLGYALMQYNIAQSSNIMWLDGVYMLPLMILGVYYVVNGKKTYLLFLTTGLAIIFNWYSAAINCIFSAFWFVFEYLLSKIGHPQINRSEWKALWKRLWVYAASMVGGELYRQGFFCRP